MILRFLFHASLSYAGRANQTVNQGIRPIINAQTFEMS